ncbi:MAG: hypothetical protein V1659_03885 [Candidatus Woesearchaeota archaeon]
METITEESSSIYSPSQKKISRGMDVFYNPARKLHRDLSILLLNALDIKGMALADPLAGSGIRAFRMLSELKPGIVKQLFVNDHNDDFFKVFEKNWSLNFKTKDYRLIPVNSIEQISGNMKAEKNFFSFDDKVLVFSQDANDFMLQSRGFSFIDLDPFGTPNPFLDSAVRRIARGGILAVGATDKSALSGAHSLACMRKYWAVPLKNELKHEFGLRILIRKVQLIGAQYDKALIPIFSYSKEHYFSVFFRCEKSKKRVDEILKKHICIFEDKQCAGPLWGGLLSDSSLLKKMIGLCRDEKLREFLELLLSESSIDSVGFFDVHALAKKHKLKSLPKMEEIMKLLDQKKIKYSRTHFSPTGIKAKMKKEEFIELIH